jgi:hypothetical protein
MCYKVEEISIINIKMARKNTTLKEQFQILIETS